MIRELRKEDIAAYEVLSRALDNETKYRLYAPEEPRPNFAEETEHFLRGENNAIFVMDEGGLVGYLQAIGNAASRTRHVVSINVAILQAYTGKGHGGRLFATLEAWARAKGITRLALSVMEDNRNAIKLYERLGFQREGMRYNSMRIDGEYVDEICMYKMLD